MGKKYFHYISLMSDQLIPIKRQKKHIEFSYSNEIALIDIKA